MKRKPNHKRPLKPEGSAGSAGSRSMVEAPSSRGRKWQVRILALCIPLVVVFGGAELLLRAFGYGFDPHFFKPASLNGRDCFVANENFGLRFFPRGMVRFPSPVVMPAAKAPDTFRIFIFGESAAMGDPRPNFGAGCYLEVLLAERYPGAKFEIINTGVTAISSHAVLPIAQECARHEGDLWLVYMGNNEMVGPFGAVTVFGARAPPLWLVRAQLQLQRLRLCQLLVEVSHKLQKPGANNRWQGMQMFARNQVSPDDPARERVYRNFERNLDDVLRAGLDSGAKIVLSTVAVNLKDCPPFGSVSGPPPAAGGRTEYETLCRAGTAEQTQGRFAQAAAKFQQAAEMCPQSAEVRFQLATCQLALTNASAARLNFQAAADDDALPFRADTRINAAIRTAARQHAGASLILCDAAGALGANSPDGVPGRELFYEHVHLNPDGNYALAVAWAGQIETLLAPALKRGAMPDWASQTECEQLLGLTDWNRVSILEDILRRIQTPPFSGQVGNAEEVARLRAEIDGVRQRLTSEAAVSARAIYQRALRRAPENFRVHEACAEFLEAAHELTLAIAERAKVCELVPGNYFPCYALGVDLKEAGRLPEARAALLKAAALKPDECDILVELGMVYARQNEWEKARQELEVARRSAPDDPRIPLYLGEVLWMLERRSEALASLREAIRLAPTDWQPHYRLASDLAKAGSFSEAVTEYQAALRLNATHVKSKLGLAGVLANLGRQPEALRQLDEVLVLDPGNQAANQLRQKLRGR
jgi:tetratricopeptide (TPR) repeat protein